MGCLVPPSVQTSFPRDLRKTHRRSKLPSERASRACFAALHRAMKARGGNNAASGEPIDADYIVVGAGSAGCVLAARLHRIRRHSVLLLEAGGEDRHVWIHVPLGYGKLFVNPRSTGCTRASPSPNSAAAASHAARQGARRLASINGLVYIRGQQEDFDHWGQLGNRMVVR